jgi:hypothetical protein
MYQLLEDEANGTPPHKYNKTTAVAERGFGMGSLPFDIPDLQI